MVSGDMDGYMEAVSSISLDASSVVSCVRAYYAAIANGDCFIPKPRCTLSQYYAAHEKLKKQGLEVKL